MHKTFIFFSLLFLLHCKGVTQSEKDTKPFPTQNLTCIKGQQFSLKLPSGIYHLKNAPKGMHFFPNGLLTWTPTNDQDGEWLVSVLNQQNQIIKHIHISVSGMDILYNGCFVDFSYQGTEKGTPTQPFNSLQKASDYLKSKINTTQKIYIRGGEYYNTKYGQNLDNRAFASLKNYNGTAKKPLIITAWGNEHVLIKSDGSAAFAIRKSHFVKIKQLEFEGVAQQINFQDVINNWWQTPNYYKGSGLSINQDCHDILITNCIVHDFPGAGITAHNSDAIVIKQNIIYNNAWWSISGTGGAIINGSKKLSETLSEISGNLIFNVESRIISRVFSKGFATMAIDEGKAILLQEYKDNGFGYNYQKSYQVFNNHLAYNGKGITVNKASHAHIHHNSLFYSKSLRIGSLSHDILLTHNAVEVVKGSPWLSISHQNTAVKAVDNFFNNGSIIKYRPNKNIQIEQNTGLDKVFENWHQPVRTVIKNNCGASQKSWDNLSEMIDLYAIKIHPHTKTYTRDSIQKMADQIIDVALKNFPEITITCLQSSNNSVKVMLKNIPKKFVKENNLPSNSFILFFKHGYDGRFCK